MQNRNGLVRKDKFAADGLAVIEKHSSLFLLNQFAYLQEYIIKLLYHLFLDAYVLEIPSIL